MAFLDLFRREPRWPSILPEAPVSILPVQEVPIYSFSGWRQAQVQAALDAFEVGAMYWPHQMFIAMLRSATFAHGIEGRVTSLVDADFEWRKSPEMPQAIFDEWVARWPDAFDENELASAVRFRIGLGLAPAQCTWTAGGTSYWLRRCHVFDTGNLTWFPTERRYKIVTQDKGQQTIDDDADPWILFKERAASYPHLHAASRSLAVDWWLGSESERLEAVYARRCGNPIWKVTGPVEQKTETDDRNDMKALVRVAQTVHGNGVFQALNGPDGKPLFDLDFIEAKGDAHKVFDIIIDRSDTRITLRLLGGIDNTQGGRDGSRARADVHQKQSNKYLGADGKLTERTLNRIAAKWVELNRWPRTWAPKAHWEVDPPEDQAELADVRQKYATAAEKLITILPLMAQAVQLQDPRARIDVKKMLEQHQIPLIEPGEQDPRLAPTEPRALPPETPPPAPAPAPSPGREPADPRPA